MPAPKIVKFKGESYFECMWTGVKLTSCYALPEFDTKGRRSKGGSFADAACAVAWINSKYKEGKTKEKKLSQLAADLGLSADEELLEAPECPPVEEYDFSYRNKFPWMFKPEIHVTVAEALEWKEEGAEEKDEEKKEPQRKVLIYDLNGEVADPPFYKGSLIFSTLLDGLVFAGNSGQYNSELEEKTGVKAFGDALVILSKKPNWNKKSKRKNVGLGGGEGNKRRRVVKVE